MATTKTHDAENWINNVRVDFNAGNPLLIRVDFSLGPFYEIGDLVRLVDLDPTAGHVVGIVKDVLKNDKGLFAQIQWPAPGHEFQNWDPYRFDK